MGTPDEINFYTDNSGTYNCYAFALGAKDGVYGHPGAASGSSLKTLVPTDIDAALRDDGLMKAPHEYGEMPPAREGFYLIAAVATHPVAMGRTGVGDYHFYRQMDDGSWWHDPGRLAPTNVDAENMPITNPELARRDYTTGTAEGNPSRDSGYDNGRANYNVFVGYYYVPDTGLSVAPGMLPLEIIDSLEVQRENEARQRLEAGREMSRSDPSQEVDRAESRGGTQRLVSRLDNPAP